MLIGMLFCKILKSQQSWPLHLERENPNWVVLWWKMQSSLHFPTVFVDKAQSWTWTTERDLANSSQVVTPTQTREKNTDGHLEDTTHHSCCCCWFSNPFAWNLNCKRPDHISAITQRMEPVSPIEICLFLAVFDLKSIPNNSLTRNINLVPKKMFLNHRVFLFVCFSVFYGFFSLSFTIFFGNNRWIYIAPHGVSIFRLRCAKLNGLFESHCYGRYCHCLLGKNPTSQNKLDLRRLDADKRPCLS